MLWGRNEVHGRNEVCGVRFLAALGSRATRVALVTLATVLLALALTTTATSAPECTINWTGKAGTSWFEEAMWSPERLP